MTAYVEIAVNIKKVSGEFHYHLPPDLEGKVKPGHLVVVPFGRQNVQGVVLRMVDAPSVANTRAVGGLLDNQIVVTQNQIRLAYHLSERTLAPLAACINLMLPSGIGQQADTIYTLIPGADQRELTAVQRQLTNLLAKLGPLRGRQIDRRMPRTRWRQSAGALIRRKIIESEPILPDPTVRARKVRTATLIADADAVAAAESSLGRAGTQAWTRRRDMLQFLLKDPGPVNVSWIYAASGGNLADLRHLEKLGLVTLGENEVWRDPLADLIPQQAVPPTLTPDQNKAWEMVHTGIQQAAEQQHVHPYLLHGVTGSGKTEIYLRAVAETLQRGRQAIVLVPEIALTPQTIRRFTSRFPGKVGIIHSQLSPGERYDTWRRVRDGKIPIIVGPRSALFSPMPDLGLIVVDECHDGSYYQADPPFYHAREAAMAYAWFSHGVCLMGSATPEVTTMYRAQERSWQIIRLPQRILAHKAAIQAHLARLGKSAQQTHRYHPLENDATAAELPGIEIVDMRQELKAGNRSIFSRVLQERLTHTLAQGQQAILFLNRRGSATYVFCRDCGHALRCPRCDEVPLTLHQGNRKLICHHCGYSRNMPKKCSECQSTRIRHYGTGTERVETAVQEQFPGAVPLRWDWETTRQKGTHEIILDHFANQRANVLIGTQMLAKGLDLPLVTLVGIVLADVGLNLPDFHAGERAFQVLTQVAGRAGRSPLGGEVILQTFMPDHYVIQAVQSHNYQQFYDQEIRFREKLGYPPFSSLVRLEYRHREADLAELAAQQMAVQLEEWIKIDGKRQTKLIGPVPCFYSRLDGWYRWQIILRGPNPAALLQGRSLGDWRVEPNPQGLL